MGSTASRPDNSCVVPQLPEEIIRGEILARLPVKLLVRFRCVCKSWNYLLSADPDFVRLHLTRNLNNNNSSSLIIRCAPHVNYRTFHPLKSFELQLAGSVNGLVCVYHKFLGPMSCVGIWNPATNQYKDIPIPSIEACNVSGRFQVTLGFGFDHIANDYKVVCIGTTRDSPVVGLVYSCNAGSWGTSFTSTFLSRGTLFGWPTIVHECPYWSSGAGFGEHNNNVMYFDCKDEDFKLLPRIEFVNESAITHMVNLRDSLAFIVYELPESSTRVVDVYVFDEICGSWSKNYTVGPITLPRYMKFINCFKNGDLLFNSGDYIKLVSVNPETHAIDRLKSGIYVYDSSHVWLFMSYSFTYIESLASVKGMHLMHVRKVGTDLMIIEQSS